MVVHNTERLKSVALGTLWAVPLALRRYKNVHTLKVEPLQPTVGSIAADHLRHLVVGTLTVAVQLLRVHSLGPVAIGLLVTGALIVIVLIAIVIAAVSAIINCATPLMAS